MPTTFVDRFFYSSPLLVIGLGLLVALAVAMLAGALARGLWQARQSPEGPIVRQEDHVVGAALGMLALLLGFTFSMAIDRYDHRRSLVTAEANAISSAYLLGQTFPEPDRTRISGILGEYVDHRLLVAREVDPEKARLMMKDSARLKAEFWAAALSATVTRRDDVASSFLQAGNGMLEVARQREAARRASIPTPVHVVTIIFLLIVAAILGSAHTEGAPRVSIATLVLLTMTMLMIIDLDRPNSGRLRESQKPMELLREDLYANTPAEFQRLQGSFNSPAAPTAPASAPG